ncbi:MAG: FMN-binding protein [Clostridia bacterium]
MKKLVLILFIFIFLTTGISCTSKEVRYQKGRYEGLGEGHHGPIKVMVETDEYKVIAIEVIEEYEMPELSSIVYDKIPKRVLKMNNAEVEVVAGATYTSKGLIEAIEDAIEKAEIKEEQ